MLYLKFKRVCDTLLAFIGIIITSPLFLFLMVAIKLDSKGPIFFVQKRVGKNKKYFNIYKFRTMKIDTPKETPTHLLENPKQWITRVGRFLRKTSLDEFPQLINILFGQMSVVGPRPALWNQFDLIEERDKYGANDICPGITGWAQVNGRDLVSIKDKAYLDGQYILKVGLLFDMKILFITIIRVLISKDIDDS